MVRINQESNEMNETKNLLVLNLGVDVNDTSLGFTQTWIEELNKDYKIVDVITMRIGNNNLSENIEVNFINKNDKKLSKIKQLIRINRTFKHVLKNKSYDHCFAHMSPLLLVAGWPQLRKKRIKSTLWFTHPGPKLSIKKIILILATLVADNIVTASSNSFPYKVNKLNVTGHGIDFSRFERTNKKDIKKFLYLGRISASKNVEVIVENFIRFNSANANKFSLTLIGGPLNKQDRIYLNKLKNIIGNNAGIRIAGKIPHKKLNAAIKEFDCNINLTDLGFFDKAVLETLGAGLINICFNADYKQFYLKEYQDTLFIKSNLNELEAIFEYAVAIDSKEIEMIVEHASTKLEEHSLKSLPKRLSKVFFSS